MDASEARIRPESGPRDAPEPSSDTFAQDTLKQDDTAAPGPVHNSPTCTSGAEKLHSCPEATRPPATSKAPLVPREDAPAQVGLAAGGDPDGLAGDVERDDARDRSKDLRVGREVGARQDVGDDRGLAVRSVAVTAEQQPAALPDRPARS